MIEASGKLLEIKGLLEGKGRLLILTHNNPDPDSIGSAFGLRHALSQVMKIKTTLAYGGVIGRAENRSMVRLLRIPLHQLSPALAARYKNVALVDAQPGGKNIVLHKKAHCEIVIDHHTPSRKCPSRFMDLRDDYGATSTIITEYIKDNGIPLNARVATALYYGIKTDIGDLGRDGGDKDWKMLQYLFPKISLKWLSRIENASVPPSYFRHYVDAVNNALIFRELVVSDLGVVTSRDAVAQMADFLLKIDGVRWSLCYGLFEEGLYFSLRTRRKGKKAGKMALRLAGRKGSAGGHDRSAAGFLPLAGKSQEEIMRMKKELGEKFRRLLGRESAVPVPLAPEGELRKDEG